jgi:hypothetical protein
VVSVINDDDDEDIGAAAYFCFQHKDQAEQLAARVSTGPATHLYPLKERSSIDTLVERLGVLEVDEPVEPRKKRGESRSDNPTSGQKPQHRINRPPTWDKVEGPFMSIPSDGHGPPNPHHRGKNLASGHHCAADLQTKTPSRSFDTRSARVSYQPLLNTFQRLGQCSKYRKLRLESIRGAPAQVFPNHHQVLNK